MRFGMVVDRILPSTMYAVALCACGGGHDPGDSVVNIVITGSEDAWENVDSFSIEGKQVRLPPARIGSNEFQVGMSLCTTNRSDFLRKDTLTAEVVMVGGMTVTSTLERLACHVMPDPGYAEHISVELRPDASVDADYGSKPNIFDSCSPGASWKCEKDEL